MNTQDLKPGQHFVTVTQGMRGWFACEMWINNTHEHGLDDFPEPWESDPVTFDTKEEAIPRARWLAGALGIPYIE